jgi:two-component system, LytTR family, response regulator
MPYQVLIVDDEPLARERIRTLIHEETGFEVCGESENGMQAVAAIQRDHPDLVFLDVQMPELDGFGVIEAIGPRMMPAVVFTTAFDQYALRAFDENAVDYLLKPFDATRFRRALERCKEQLTHRSGDGVTERMMKLLQSQTGRKPLERLVIRSDGRVVFLKTKELDYVEAAGNYLSLHVGKDTYLIRETMNSFEAKLDPQIFMRIHRSTIVNIERIKEIHPWFKGEYVVSLRDGKELRLSRTYREKLQHLMDGT